MLKNTAVYFVFNLAFLLGLAQALISGCSDSGTQTESGFTFTYTRDGDLVYITASVDTDTWVAIGFSEDELMVNRLKSFHVNMQCNCCILFMQLDVTISLILMSQ